MSSNSVVPQGPFRATRLWNDLVSLFQTRMVCKKHFYRFKIVNNCFTGAEAVEWLHSMLQTHKHYGKHVTVDHTTRLLKKFLKFHVIEDLSGRHGTEEFTSNSKLYRFPTNAKSAGIIGFDYRQPFASKDLNNFNNGNLGDADPIVKYSAGDDDVTVSNLRKSQLNAANKTEEIPELPTQKQLLEICYFERLECILHLTDDGSHDFLLSLKDEKIMNQIEMNVNNKGFDISDCLPVWLLKIMKCVANWPYNDDNDYPPYEGFERDMFKAIVEYFNKAQSIPLLTSSLYDTWVKIYSRCQSLDERCHDRKHHTEKESNGDSMEGVPDSTLVENIQKKLMQAKMRHENLANRKMKKKCHQRGYIGSTDPSSAGGRIGYTHESAFQHSIHQSMHDLSRLGDHNNGNGQSTAGFFGSKALVKSARAKCASHYHLSRKLPHHHQMEIYNDDVIVDDVDKIYSHDDTEPLTTFAPLNKDTQATVMSSVDNLLLDMSCCGDLTFANIGSTSTPTRSTQQQQQNSHNTQQQQQVDEQQQQQPHMKDDEILLLSSSSEDDSGPIENWTADSINTLSNRHKRARSEMDLKDKTIVHRLEVPPPMLHRSREGSRHRIQSRYIPQQSQISPDVGTTSYQPKLRNPPRRSTSSAGRSSSSANNQHHQYYGSKRRGGVGGIKSSRPLSVIIQSPMKSDDFTTTSSASTLKPINHDRRSRDKYMSMSSLNKTSSTITCQSPLSVALKQAKRQLTAKKVKEEDLHACEAFQLCLLSLPPANRRTLLLFFRFADKILNNPHLLHLDDHLTPRGLLIEKFTNSILRKEDDGKKDEIIRQIFGFLLDHSREIFGVVHDCVQEKNLSSKLQSLKIEREKKVEESKKYFGAGGYCEQVSKEEYERQKIEDSEIHLVNLLRNLCEDESVPAKERKRRLKQFQKAYPDIYEKHANKIIFNEITTKKTPFALAIQKIRQMRL